MMPRAFHTRNPESKELSDVVRTAIIRQGGLQGAQFDGDYIIGVIIASLEQNDLVLTGTGLKRLVRNKPTPARRRK